MKRNRLLLVALVLVAVPLMFIVGCSSTKTTTNTTPATPKTTSTSPSGTSSSVTVKMVDFAFQPANLTIKTGTTVTWVNNGAVAHEPAGTGFDTGPIQPGQNASHTFNTAGTFPYKCVIHPTIMTGTITVNGTGQSTGGGTSSSTSPSSTSSIPGY